MGNARENWITPTVQQNTKRPELSWGNRNGQKGADERDSIKSRQKLWWREKNLKMTCRSRTWVNGLLAKVFNKNGDSREEID